MTTKSLNMQYGQEKLMEGEDDREDKHSRKVTFFPLLDI